MSTTRTIKTGTVKVALNLSDFLGSDENAIAKINIDDSKANFEVDFLAELNRIHPEIEWEITWNGTENTNYNLDENTDAYQIHTDMLDAFDRIYNMQGFWVEAEQPFGVAKFEGSVYRIIQEPYPSSNDFPGSEPENDYQVEWVAESVGADGNHYKIYWRFWETAGSEKGPDGYNWSHDEIVSVERC